MSRMKLLTIVVERSHGMAVIDALAGAGIEAVTMLAGTGIGVWHKVEREVDGEKAVMLAVVPEEKIDAAFGALHSEAGLTEPGRGIAYVTPVESGIGFGLPGWD